MKKLISIILGIFLTFSLFAEARNALLIANGDYAKFGKLAAPVNEARDLKKTLEKLGFTVTLVENGSRETMIDSLYDFEETLRKSGGIGFFHYVGHGVPSDGKNYLIPVDADIPDASRLSTRAVNVDEVMASMQADTNIVILDAETNYFSGDNYSYSRGHGLALVKQTPKNFIIAYSTQSGMVSYTGVFTPILMENISEPKDFYEILRDVRKDVIAKTNGKQISCTYDFLRKEIYLSGNRESSFLAESRNALLIANGNYKNFSSLTSPVNEARDLKKTLEKLGFKVTLVENANQEQMFNSLYNFEEILRKSGGVGFFHYNGHGIQVDGQEYLIPIDADIPDARRVSFRAVDVDSVMESMQADTNIVVLDSNRDNPLPSNTTKGLPIFRNLAGKPKDLIIVYSAAPRRLPYDGVFTPILTSKLLENKEIYEIFRDVRNEVIAKTDGIQVPGVYDQFTRNVYFVNNSETTENIYLAGEAENQ